MYADLEALLDAQLAKSADDSNLSSGLRRLQERLLAGGALDALDDGEQQLHSHAAGELLAEDLRAAQKALEEITGAFTADDLLGRIFSSFCIGK